MNPFVIFMTIWSFVKWLISDRPDIVADRKATEEWAKRDVKQPFLDGYNGVPNTRPDSDPYWKHKVVITFAAFVALMILMAKGCN